MREPRSVTVCASTAIGICSACAWAWRARIVNALRRKFGRLTLLQGNEVAQTAPPARTGHQNTQCSDASNQRARRMRVDIAACTTARPPMGEATLETEATTGATGPASSTLMGSLSFLSKCAVVGTPGKAARSDLAHQR